jgi:DNA-directed RNA polymerase specialized sigma24 family protein
MTAFAAITPALGDMTWAPDDNSVTMWLRQLETGDVSEAQHQLWNRYFGQLVQIAQWKLRAVARRVADEEDVVLSALDSFFADAAAGRYPKLTDRHSLWPLLVRITSCKALNQQRDGRALKRGGGQVRGESMWQAEAHSSFAPGIQGIADSAPPPEMIAQMAEQCDRLLQILDGDLLAVAKLKLEGLTTNEIARRIGCSPRTVERRLESIREQWAEDFDNDD